MVELNAVLCLFARATYKNDGCGFILTRGNETFNIFNSSLWLQDKARRWERSVLTLGSYIPTAHSATCGIYLKYIYPAYSKLGSEMNPKNNNSGTRIKPKPT